MPTSPKGPCTFPGCPNRRTTGRRCDIHQRRGDAPRRDGWIYSDRRYQPWRKRVMGRDPVCRRCNERPSEQADHIVPVIDGGPPFDPSNGQGLCEPCHKLKTREDRRRRREAPGGGPLKIIG